MLLRTVAPAQLAGLLYLGAAAGLLPVVVSPRRRSRRVGRRGAIRLAGAIAFGGVGGPLLLLLGLQLAAATSVSLWLNMELVATAVWDSCSSASTWGGRDGSASPVWRSPGIILAGAEAESGAMAAVFVTLACVCWGLDNHLTALIDEMSATQATFLKCGVAGTVQPASRYRHAAVRSVRIDHRDGRGRRRLLLRRKHRPLRQRRAAPRRDACPDPLRIRTVLRVWDCRLACSRSP